MTIKEKIFLDFLRPIVDLEIQLRRLNDVIYQNDLALQNEISLLKLELEELKKEMFVSLSPLQRLNLVRQARRPTTLDFIPYILDEWIELHGDRRGTDDSALVGGVGRLENQTVVFIGHQRGKDTKDNVVRNFGMPSPGGYRKALRLMHHANRFNFPVLTFIDTPGAWAGIEAETLGQGEAIAVNLREMFSLEVPIICTVIGEGGSGGALGIGVGDKILMLEYSVYTVATPEACAAILWKNSKKSFEAAEALKITSLDLKALGIVDNIIKEPIGGSQIDPYITAMNLKEALIKELNCLLHFNAKQRMQIRYSKFRRIGTFYEVNKSIHSL